MEDVTRKRIMRQLEALPDAQLYQVMDYIEFVMAKYAAAAARQPDAFQRFAERVEDQMRVRSLAPKAMKGTMKIMSTAGKVIEGVRDLGRDLTAPPPPRVASPAGAAEAGSGAGKGADGEQARRPPTAGGNGSGTAAREGAEPADEGRA